MASIVPALVLAPPVRAAELDDAWTYTRKATRALLGGDAEAALRLYRMGLDRAPGFPPAELGLGHVAMVRGENHTALEHYVAARRGYAAPSVPLARIEAERRSDAREAMQRLELEREEALRKLDEIDSRGEVQKGDAERSAKLEALVRARELQIGQLLALATEAETVPPGVPADVEFHLGNAFFKLGRLREAVEAWEACASLHQSFGLVHRNLAVAYAELDRTDRARAALAEADRLGAPVPPALRRRLSETEAPTKR